MLFMGKNYMKHTTSTLASGTPGRIGDQAMSEISGALRQLLADAFALYLKTKNFHWHMRGKHFRDYHLLLDDHAEQIFSITDDIAERARKIGGTTIRAISDISRHQRLSDNNEESVSPGQKLSELRDDSLAFTAFLRKAHEICAKYNDVAATSLIEVWIDQAERRTWFLAEIVSGFDADATSA
jgi:starvation-inducible DNA-binding protein